LRFSTTLNRTGKDGALLRLVTPDLRVTNVLELSVERLRGLGIEAVLLDVDCTLKDYRATALTPPVQAWLAGLQAAGMGACLVSNGRMRRLGPLAESLKVPLVCEACKPLPFALRRGMLKLGFAPARTAMIGDQIFADVMAGRLAGLKTILVTPSNPREEPWFTRIKRPFERVLLGWWDRKV
jgi:HAD superfamily phosphatase (TIGR01668 family)